MTTADILAALPRLTLEELAQVQARLNDLAHAHQLPVAARTAHVPAAVVVPDHARLDETHDTYDVSPDGGSTWDTAKPATPPGRTAK